MESNGGSLENVAEIFVLFLCGVQLVLRYGVLTILDLDEVGTSITNAYSTHFVKSSGLNAKAKFHYRCRADFC